MKHLQNNFTTPEQSKRLLELGLPADSADCFYINDEYRPNVRDELYERNTGYKFPFSEEGFTPCWSVGRLIEIFRICGDIECLTWLNARYSRWDIEDLVQSFELYAQEDDILPETVLNFSKL